jgi:hypothetical protein
MDPADRQSLKVPKCEIFDRSDFRDFYRIMSLWEGDFVIKILHGTKIILKSKRSKISHLGTFKEDFLRLGKKKFFRKLVRPFVRVKSDLLKFSLFRYLKNYRKYGVPCAHSPTFMHTLSILVRN